MRRSWLSSGLAVAAWLGSAQAGAQEAQAASAQPQQPAAQSAPSTTADVAPLTPASTTPMPVPEDLLQAHPGGLTADQVGQRAMATSFAAKQSIETMRAAEARVDAAWAAFLPRLTGTAKYTRLSLFTPPSLTGGATSPGSLVVSPVQTSPGGPPVALGNNPALFAYNTPAISIPIFPDNWLFQGTLTIPISDYLLRIDQTYTAATRSADAAHFDIGAARATALTNGKVAYYSWLQARGSVVVAVQTLNDQRIHLNDARNQFTVGNASKADVMRAETAVAQSELALVNAENAADLAEAQMRIALHSPNAGRLVPGEGLDVAPPPVPGTLDAFMTEGVSQRLELKSIRANAASARKTAEANKAGRFPVLTAFGDVIEANPNPRYFGAQTPIWFPTWDVGVQALWAPNDILTANGGAADYEARANALDAQAQVTLEGIQIEVTQDFQTLRAAEFSLDSTRRELASATEAYRVAHELFNNGRGTSTTLLDAERDLTVARIDALTAQVNARIARVRLEHAVGRDVKSIGTSP